MGSFTALRLITVLSLRRAWRGRVVWLTVAMLSLVLVAALVTLASGYADLAFFKRVVEVYLRYLVPFIMALHGSHAVAEEVQDKTITYLFSRPIPRWSLPLGKYLGNLAVTTPLLCVSLALVYVVSLLTYPSEIPPELPWLGRGLVAVCLAAVLFGAISTAFGTLFSGHPFVVNLIFLLIVEVGVSHIPGWTKLVAMNVHLRAVAGVYQAGSTLSIADPELTGGVSLVVLVAMSLVWIGLTAGWSGAAEYRTDQ